MTDSQTMVVNRGGRPKKKQLIPGKEQENYKIVWETDLNFYVIKNISGMGEVPNALKGMFTQPSYANTAIKSYMNSKRG